MADQKLATYLIWGIITTVIFLGGALMIDELTTNYNLNTTNTSFANTFGAVEDITNNTKQLEGYLDDTQESSEAGSFVLTSFGSVLSIVGGTFEFIASLIVELIELLGLGTFGISLGLALVAIFSIITIFLIITFLWRSNRGLI